MPYLNRERYYEGFSWKQWETESRSFVGVFFFFFLNRVKFFLEDLVNYVVGTNAKESQVLNVFQVRSKTLSFSTPQITFKSWLFVGLNTMHGQRHVLSLQSCFYQETEERR